MKKIIKTIGKIIKYTITAIIVTILLFFIIRAIGKAYYNRTPQGGINESIYVEINGTKQWISIYGEDINNPVLLYLHGGPGTSTSLYDYAFTRQWADIYTVVTWDQRNCGKSYSPEQNNTELTYELLMSDGVEMTQFILKHLGKDKITLLGHSWGTYYGCNLVLEYPEYYEAYIGTGQLINFDDNETAFKEAASQWVGNDEEGLTLLNRLNVNNYTADYYAARNSLMIKYGYDMFADGTDYNLSAAQYFNPYYTLSDFLNYINAQNTVYENFISSEEFDKFSLTGRYEYQVPYYNINGDKDYQTNYLIAQNYFDKIQAPDKKIYIMKNTTHGLLESKSKEFSEILHEIAELNHPK